MAPEEFIAAIDSFVSMKPEERKAKALELLQKCDKNDGRYKIVMEQLNVDYKLGILAQIEEFFTEKAEGQAFALRSHEMMVNRLTV